MILVRVNVSRVAGKNSQPFSTGKCALFTKFEYYQVLFLLLISSSALTTL